MGISALAQLLSTTANGVTPGSNSGDPNMPLFDFAALLADQLPAGLQKDVRADFPPGLALGLRKDLTDPGTTNSPDPTDTAPLPELATNATPESGTTLEGTLAMLSMAQQTRNKGEERDKNKPEDDITPPADPTLAPVTAGTPLAINPGRMDAVSDRGPAEASASAANATDPSDGGTVPEQWIPNLPAAIVAHANVPNTPAAEIATPINQGAAGDTPESTASTLASGTANLAAENNSRSDNGFANLMVGHAAAVGRTNDTQTNGTGVRVDTPLHDHHWAPNFSERVVWLAKNEQQTAQININPPQLGPVQVTINLTGDQASAAFVSPHAEVRQAIQDAMPQLREMLSAAGINLGQANVGSQLAQQGREFASQFADQTRSSGENDILPADSLAAAGTASQPIRRGRGMVDLFA